MSPLLLLIVLIACLVALLPVWRLRVAGWPRGWLLAAWITYAVAILVALWFAGSLRFLLPVIVLAFVAPFVAGPERLTRVLAGRRPPERPIVDVTPSPAPALREPARENDDEGTDDR
jgi:hypothetical protein